MFTPIPGWEEYEISKEGLVYSHKVGRVLINSINTSGYYFITFTDIFGKQKRFLIHRLLAFVYLDLPDLCSSLEVDHNDGNKRNNSLSNLVVRDREEHLNKTLKPRGLSRITQETLTCSCGKPKSKRATLCKDCHINSTMINKEITVEQIEYWVTNFSWIRAAKELGLSDNGLRKRYRNLSGKDPKELTRR